MKDRRLAVKYLHKELQEWFAYTWYEDSTTARWHTEEMSMLASTTPPNITLWPRTLE